MNKNIKRNFLIYSIATLVTSAFAQPLNLKIGVLTDLSGPYADMAGKGSLAAAQMAVADFIKQNPGSKIEILSADHQNKADIASGIANKWFDQEKVEAIFDLPNSSVALAVQSIAQAKKKITITSGAATTELTGKSCSPTGFHWTFDAYAMSHGTAKALYQEGAKSWFLLTADYNFGHSMEKEAESTLLQLGGKIVAKLRHPFPSTDFSSFLLQAISSKASAIGLANAGADTINAIKQASEMGVTKKGQKLAAFVLFLSDVHSLGLNVAQNLIFTDGFYWDMNAETRAWSQQFATQREGKMPTMVQAGVYSAVNHYLKSVKAAGGVDGIKVANQMKKTKIQDFFAKNGKLRNDGRMIHDMYLMQVKTPQESKAPWDYLKVLKTIPADQAYKPLSQSECALVKK